MKQMLSIAMALCLALGLLSGAVLAESPARSAVLYADFSYGATEAEAGDLIQTHELPYEGELTPELLAEGLSELTGLDFEIDSFAETDDGLSVDWAAESTLLMGLDEREQKDGFFFYDVETLSWFMLDSLSRTLRENLGYESIYYTMNGGEDLVLESGGMTLFFPVDGGPFYPGTNAAPSDDDAVAVDIQSPLMLVETIAFEGMEADSSAPIEGGYRFDDRTADGIVCSTNMAFPNPEAFEALDEVYAALCVGLLENGEPVSDLRAFEDEGYSIQFTYPVLLCYWDTGENEDLRTSTALIIPTDTHTYLYRLSIHADSYDDYIDEIESVFSGLTLEDMQA